MSDDELRAVEHIMEGLNGPAPGEVQIKAGRTGSRPVSLAKPPAPATAPVAQTATTAQPPATPKSGE